DAAVRPRKAPFCERHTLPPTSAVLCTFEPGTQRKALRIMRCESGGRTGAVNGQYRGLFQLGTHERKTYAYNGYVSALSQVRAAWNMYTWRGWQPWRECSK